MLIVTYDIADNRRRYRIDKTLCGYGVRVQKSVFECHLDTTELEQMIEELKQHILNEEDSICLYSLCKKDRKRIHVDGRGEVTKDWDYLII